MKYGFIKHVPTGTFLNYFHNGNIYAEKNFYEASLLSEKDAKWMLSKKTPLSLTKVLFQHDDIEINYYSKDLSNDEFKFTECEITLKK